MKARLLKEENGAYKILCSDGTIAEANKHNLNQILQEFKMLDKIKSDKERWNIEYPDMITYPGETYAYVTEHNQLVIYNFAPFEKLLEVDTGVCNMIPIVEYARLQGKSVEQIKFLCRNNRIAGAQKMGRDWMIPADAPYPIDKRRGR